MTTDGDSMTFYVDLGKRFEKSWKVRIAHLDPVVSSGIPCSLWGWDAVDLLFYDSNMRRVQEIIVPDDSLNTTSQMLREAGYALKPVDVDYLSRLARLGQSFPFPGSVFLEHPDAAGFGVEKEMAPKAVTIHPQSYFDIDLAIEKDNPLRILPLPAYIDKRILVPNLHTVIEGLVHCLMYPPAKGTLPNYWAINLWRPIEENQDRLAATGELEEVLKQPMTDEAKWYLGTVRGQKSLPTRDQIAEYKKTKMMLGLG
jgi:hypothetical protein